MFSNLSLGYKVPLRVSLLILIVGVAVTASLLVRAYEVFRDDLVNSSENMGRILSRSLTAAMLHDDTWKAYEIINTPYSVKSEKNALQAEVIMVLDAGNRVFISTRPSQYPILTDPAKKDDDIAGLMRQVKSTGISQQISLQNSTFGNHYVITPIESDNVLLGTLIMGYSREIFTNRFSEFSKLAGITLLAMILLMLPLGALWGRRTARPLVELSNCMRQIGENIPENIEHQIVQGGDEIGQLGSQFVLMVESLKEKEALEQQIVAAQRLAAIGRFTAGIAHEINNPLGGMLNATSTLRKHGNCDRLTEKTVQLIERGLLQIKDTVSALLVEASPDHHPLSRQDINDTRRLVQQEAAKRQININWENEVGDKLPIPSTLVRQALINLLLNAIQAAPENGSVNCKILIKEDYLSISVINDGERISDEKLSMLFEPFTTDKDVGRGLGLWVTYQIVESLGGDIEVETSDEFTRFQIRLPLPMEDAA